MCIGVAHCELSQSQGQRFLTSPPAIPLSPATFGFEISAPPFFPQGHVWYRMCDSLWWLGKIADRAPPDISSGTHPDPSSGRSYIIRFLDDPVPLKIVPWPAPTTARIAIYGFVMPLACLVYSSVGRTSSWSASTLQ